MQTQQRVLARRTNGRLIAGVAGGLADYTATPVRWWRWGFVGVAAAGWLGFLVLAPPVMHLVDRSDAIGRPALLVVLFAGGLAEWIYLALWILVPRADLSRSASFSERLKGWPGRLGLGLAIFLVGLAGMWLQLWGGAVALASLLIGAGVAIFRRGEPEESVRETVSSWNAGSDATAVLPPVDAAETPTARRRPHVRRERSKLGWLSVGLAFVAGGLIWLLDASGTTHLSASQMIAAPVVVLAIGLLAGSMFGHAKWTFLFALPLVPAMIVASAIGMPLTGVYTNRYVRPRSGSELQPSYAQTGGGLEFDLRSLPLRARPGPVHATLGVGSITVMTSPCVPVAIAANVNAGQIVFQGGRGENVGGFSVSDSLRTSGADPIVMDLHTGLGEINVERGYLTKKQRKACGS